MRGVRGAAHSGRAKTDPLGLADGAVPARGAGFRLIARVTDVVETAALADDVGADTLVFLAGSARAWGTRLIGTPALALHALGCAGTGDALLPIFPTRLVGIGARYALPSRGVAAAMRAGLGIAGCSILALPGLVTAPCGRRIATGVAAGNGPVAAVRSRTTLGNRRALLPGTALSALIHPGCTLVIETVVRAAITIVGADLAILGAARRCGAILVASSVASVLVLATLVALLAIALL